MTSNRALPQDFNSALTVELAACSSWHRRYKITRNITQEREVPVHTPSDFIVYSLRIYLHATTRGLLTSSTLNGRPRARHRPACDLVTVGQSDLRVHDINNPNSTLWSANNQRALSTHSILVPSDRNLRQPRPRKLQVASEED